MAETGGKLVTVEALDYVYDLLSKEIEDALAEAEQGGGGGGGGDTTDLENRIQTLEEQMAELLYTPIEIRSFTNNVGNVEMGSTVNRVILTWELNKIPESVTVNGIAQNPDTTFGVTHFDEAVTSDKTYILEATDEKGNTANATTRVVFLNGVYFGEAAAPSTYNSAFILGLTKELRATPTPSFSVDAGSGQYIYYCLPTRMGECSFTVGGFTGGFTLVDTISFTNASGYAENYYIYKSDNANLGSTSVSVV